jgi:hypothetical protein
MKSYKATIISTGISIICGIIHVYTYYLSANTQDFFAIIDDGYALSACILFSLIVIAYGIYIDVKRNNSIQSSSREQEIHTSMISAMHHILNNFLNGMELVRLEARTCKDFDPKVMNLYDQSVHEAVDKIKSISKLEELSDDAIWDKLMPGMGSPLKK